MVVLLPLWCGEEKWGQNLLELRLFFVERKMPARRNKDIRLLLIGMVHACEIKMFSKQS